MRCRRRAPRFSVAWRDARRGLECVEKFRRDDDVLGRDDIDAMGERRPAQIGVEQRDDAADAGDAEPDRQVFGPVWHQQPDRVAFGEILRRAPSAHSGWRAPQAAR